MRLAQRLREWATGEDLQAWLTHSDQAALVVRLQQAASRNQQSLTDYASTAIIQCVDHADEQTWRALSSATGEGTTIPVDPAAACLALILERALCAEAHARRPGSGAIRPAYDEDYGGSSPCFLHEI